jgi:two-component system, LytTR family, response regulator
VIRALIVDDEPPARRRLRRALAGLSEVEIVGEAGNAREALALIERHDPNLLLLDIQMPNGTGFDLLADLQDHAPAVIFVTAFDQYAVAAFEARAVDYVLKPVDFARLAAAIERARGALARRENDHRLGELQSVVATLRRELKEQADKDPVFWVSSRGEVYRVAASDIVWIEAERDYVRIHTGQRSYLYHESLASLEARLDPSSFIRVHRSAIVHRRRVRSFRRGSFSSLYAVLLDDTEVRVGRTYEPRIRAVLRSDAPA